MFDFKIGEPVRFVMGVHQGEGTLVQVRNTATRTSLLLEVAPLVFELVYADEVVR